MATGSTGLAQVPVMSVLLALSLLAGVATDAGAQTRRTTRESPAPPAEGGGAGWLSELRLGVLGHNVGPIATELDDGVQANAELRFESPAVLRYVLRPRPLVGASVNTAGDTSFFYTGLVWTWNAEEGPFLDFYFGGTVHNGVLDSREVVDRKRLGSRLLFRESIEIGYRIDAHHSLSISMAHASNAGLARRNEGNDDIGIRYGYHF